MNFVKRVLSSRLNEYKRKYRPKKRKRENFIFSDIVEVIDELREHDLSYLSRVCIDSGLRVSFWYDLSVFKGFL